MILRVKIRPIDKNLSVSGEELEAALDHSPVVKVSPHQSSIGGKSFSHILGTPDFASFPFKDESPVIVPLGQYDLAVKAIKGVQGKKAMIWMLKDEYRAIVQTLTEMDVDFRVLNLEEGDRETGRWLRDSGIENVRFSAKKPTRWQVFPRDLFVYLKAQQTLLAHSRLFRLNETHIGDCTVFHTGLAEGGRLLFTNDRLIIGRHPEHSGRAGGGKALIHLCEKGMKIAKIPFALFYQISRKGAGQRLSLYYDFHIDRSASLLEGVDGKYHLVLDPGYRTGPLTNPLSVKKSLDLVRKACETIEVQVHTPKSVHVPYTNSTVQFEDGKVLATGGDNELFAIIEGIVGSGNLHVTRVPITAYPIFAGAGLHCLITENPEPLVDG